MINIHKKSLVFLLIFLFLSVLLNASCVSYPPSYGWTFSNGSCLSFNEIQNFTDTPHLGAINDNGLVGSWKMNEGAGSFLSDSSVYGNNGTIHGCTWVPGKFDSSLSLNGNSDYVVMPISPVLKLGVSNFTIMCWIKSTGNAGNYQYIISQDWGSPGFYELLIKPNGLVTFICSDGEPDVVGSTNVLDGNWHMIGVIGNRLGAAQIFVDGVADGTPQHMVGGILTNNSPVRLGSTNNGGGFYKGLIDDVQIFNRTLTGKELLMSYNMGSYAIPNSASYDNYFNYTDSATNNTLMIHVDSQNLIGNDIAKVTCTNFFTDDKLTFQSNSSAVVNLWTNLGQPAFTTGIWNSQNFTTTLNLNSSSTAELNWNHYNITTYTDAHSNVTPSNITDAYGVNQTFNFSPTIGYSFNVMVDGISQGQINNYTFSNLTSTHMINITSSLLTYTITSLGDSHSIISPSGSITVNYEGSQTFLIQVNAGFTLTNIYVDGVDKGIIYNYTFSHIQNNHNITVATSIYNFSINALSDSNGTITPSGSVTVGYGQTQQFIFTPKTGYHVSNLIVDNQSQPVSSSYSFNDILQNHTITVSFIVNSYNLNIITDVHSNIVPGNLTAIYGSNQQFNITADPGYVVKLNVDGVDEGTLTSYIFTNIQNNHTLKITAEALAPGDTLATTPDDSSQPSTQPTSTNSSSQMAQPTVTPQTVQINSFSLNLAIISVLSIVIVVIVFMIAFKLGFITIETIDGKVIEEDDTTSEEKSKNSPYDETLDY